MYDVEVVIERSAYPLRVTGVASETRAFEIVGSALAAWGIPVPINLRTPSDFAALLADRGSYTGSSGDASIWVARSA